jgi:transcriptional regulator with XRE-family HTH domain
MPSFQISVSPSRRAAGRFITRVRRAIQKALAEECQQSGLTQSDIARAIGVHRSVVNRELRGQKDMTLGRVAELALALGRTIAFELQKPEITQGSNSLPLNRFAPPATGAALTKDHVNFTMNEPKTGSKFDAKVAA